MIKVPEGRKKKSTDLSMAVLFVVCFLLRSCGMCWLDSTDRNQQRLSAVALLSKIQISY